MDPIVAEWWLTVPIEVWGLFLFVLFVSLVLFLILALPLATSADRRIHRGWGHSHPISRSCGVPFGSYKAPVRAIRFGGQSTISGVNRSQTETARTTASEVQRVRIAIAPTMPPGLNPTKPMRKPASVDRAPRLRSSRR